MRKSISKVLALLLSVALLVSVVPMYATAASAAKKDGVTMESAASFSTELSEELQSDSNLIKGAAWAGSAKYSTGKKIYARARITAEGTTTEATKIELNKITVDKLYDGLDATEKDVEDKYLQGEVLATHTTYNCPTEILNNPCGNGVMKNETTPYTQNDYYVWLNRVLFDMPDLTVGSDSVTYSWNSSQTSTPTDAVYEIIVDSNGEYNVEKIVYNFANGSMGNAANYGVYMSDSTDTLFEESSLYYSVEGNTSTTNIFNFASENKVRFVAIRITGITNITGNNAPYSYLRLSEIGVFGFPANQGTNNGDIYYDAAEIAKYEAKLKTVENLMQTHFIVTDTKGLDGSMYFGGKREGADADHKKRGTINTRASVNDIIDGDPNTHADTNIDTVKGRVIFRKDGTRNDSSVWLENTYADMTVTLKDTATVESVFLSWSKEYNERVSDYELFLLGPDGDVEKLYDAANSQFRVTNNTVQKQVYVLDAPRKIKYIGVRIYRGIQPEATHNSTYARIAELGVFGTYDNIDYFDYSATSNVGNFINESGTEIAFDPLTFTVPLFKDGYAFKEWTLNGTPVSCDVDRVNNTATVSELVGTNMELIAVYEEAPTTLSGYIYDTHDELDWILVPCGTFGIDMLYGFDNYKENVAVLNGDQEVPQTERVTTGMTVGAKAADGTVTGKLEVVNIGDGNLDGKVEVTDIVNNIEIAWGDSAPHSEKEEFAIDTNRDGLITVSDIVIARNTILNDTKLESYTDTHKNISVKDLAYKYMGRKYLKNEGTDNEAVYLEMTASGIVFEANFMGDLTVDIETSNPENEYITVVIDGVVNNDISLKRIGNNRKTTVTLARDVQPGLHTVEIYKQSESGRTLLIYGVGFNGEASKVAPKNADLLIEFVGDSITCGNGNLSEKHSNPTGRAQNGYLAYGTITANMLGADWSNISKSGSALVKKPGMGNNHMPTEYERVSIQLGSYVPYDFENAERKADIVVVNLGTNDQSLLSSMYGNDQAQKSDFFAKSAESFARKIIKKNGDDVNIVFAFGLMTDSVHYMNDCYTQVAQKLTDEGYNVWFCPLPKNTDGGAGHPNVEGDYLAAATLATFIDTNILK